MTDSDMHVMKRSRSQGEPDGTPPMKFSSAQVRRRGQVWSKHPYYYFPDGSLLLLVDGTAYCIQGSVLIGHSPYWRNALGEPKEMYEPQALSGISWQEMDAFLSVIYPRSYEQHEITSAEDWASVLRLASLWSVDDMRSLAISQLDAVAAPLYKLVLARALDVPQWIEPAFDALARRQMPLSVEEASALTMEDVLHISAKRESILKAQVTRLPAKSSSARDDTRNDSRTLVRTRTKSSSGSSRTAAPTEKSPLPPITVPFSRKELGRLSTKLSKGYEFEDALAFVTQEKIPAFCHALADFTDVLSARGLNHLSSSHSLFKRVATRPSFVPAAVKLASFIVSQNEGDEARQWLTSNLFGLRRCLQDDVNGLRSLWASVNQAKIKYPDFSVAYKSASRGHYFTAGLLGLDNYGTKPPRENEYKERSANVRQFISALSADNVRLVK
ncbi:unnamed protein product [Peniophora sp. CBMAI 1063]|nr:unnamed protein product [Peniophora sp. CBMAI 1063]